MLFIYLLLLCIYLSFDLENLSHWLSKLPKSVHYTKPASHFLPRNGNH